ncbi:hypothetical protein AVEN_10637-1 [Araneus ventricosus]|uniref:Reverse transcriptase domain-containing protein n=1 Tax=Araneus ventricosus TaxID=182803 RepID=A0A4Y2R9A5_ARAVE|nr:hypothetical protein AVEN_10637-1 [Araneus ventricosus]
MLILVSGKFLWIKSHPISPHLSPHLVGLDSKDCLSVILSHHIITPFGRFRFQRLPFGISSAPEHFQRRMSQMLEGIPGTICHMDDILNGDLLKKNMTNDSQKSARD